MELDESNALGELQVVRGILCDPSWEPLCRILIILIHWSRYRQWALLNFTQDLLDLLIFVNCNFSVLLFKLYWIKIKLICRLTRAFILIESTNTNVFLRVLAFRCSTKIQEVKNMHWLQYWVWQKIYKIYNRRRRPNPRITNVLINSWEPAI